MAREVLRLANGGWRLQVKGDKVFLRLEGPPYVLVFSREAARSLAREILRELVKEAEAVKLLNVLIYDARDIPTVEARISEYGFIKSKTVIYGYNREIGRRVITNVLYVVAVYPGKLREFNIMLTQLQNLRRLKILHFERF